MSITMTEHRIAGAREGLSLYLRNKTPAAGDPRLPSLLMVHGATYPGSLMFDYPVEGESWMDWLAARGVDVWCVDIPGYGHSGRPPEMNQPAEDNGPVIDTNEAVRNVLLAVAHICAVRDCAALDLLGYSWGTAIAGQAAGEATARIRRLVLYGALWTGIAEVRMRPPDKLGAYHSITAEAAAARWLISMTEAQKAALGPAARIEQWGHDVIASDPDSARHDPPAMRAPMGVVKDILEFWLQGRATYDPAKITAPTLVVVGEWDQETTPEQGRDLFGLLDHAPQKRFSIIGKGTHTLLLEDQRRALYGVVHEFLSGA